MSDDQGTKDRENESTFSGQEDNGAQGSDPGQNQVRTNDGDDGLNRKSGICLEKKSQQTLDQKPETVSPPADGSGAGQSASQDTDQAGSGARAGQEKDELDGASGSNGKASEAEIVSGPASAGTSQPDAEAGSDSGTASGLALAAFGPFLLLFFLAAMLWQDLWQHWQGQGLFWPQEAASLEALQKAMPAGQWLLQVGAGASLTNPLPGFYWFAGGLAHLLPWLAPGMLCQLAASLSTAILLLAVWFLALCAGLGGRAAVASGLVLLCTPILALSGNLFGPEALACALMLLSLACFSRGWQAGAAWLSLPAGFVLAGLAGLTGGLFHLFLPLAASFFLLVWRGTFRRAQGADAIAGFSLMLILVIGWLALTIIRVAPQNGLDDLVASQVQLVWPLARECWWIPAIAALGLLPWLFLPCCVSWLDRLCNAWGSLKGSRKERSGVAFLWISLCLTIACSVLASRPGSPYLVSLPLCLVCLAAPLAGSAYTGLSAIGRRFFHSLLAILLVACGLALLALSFSISVDVAAGILPGQLLSWLRDLIPALVSLPMLGLAFLVAAIGLIFFFVIRQFQGGLLYCALVCVAFYQIGYFLLVPNLAAAPNIELKSLEFHQARQNPEKVEPAETRKTDRQEPGKSADGQPESATPAEAGQPGSKDAGSGSSEGGVNDGAGSAKPSVINPAAINTGESSGQAPGKAMPGEPGQSAASETGAGGEAVGGKLANSGDAEMTGSKDTESASDNGEKPGIKSGE